MEVAMAGQGMDDEEILQWCAWFEAFLAGRSASASASPAKPRRARVVDFAENRLTERGLRSLLVALRRCQVEVEVLKLHHNEIEGGDALADFVVRCDGTLRVLDTSHNSLTTQAAARIALAVAVARDEGGAFCYPRPGLDEGAAEPLCWHVEQNLIDPALLLQRAPLARQFLGRPGVLFCEEEVGRRARAAPVEVKNISNQRGADPNASDEESWSQACDDLTVYSRAYLLALGQVATHGAQRGDRLIKQILWTGDCATLETLDNSGDGVAAGKDVASRFWTPPKAMSQAAPPAPTQLLDVADGASGNDREQLLCLLGMAPDGVMPLHELQECAPAPLSYAVQDVGVLTWWVQSNLPGVVQVFGALGAEQVGLMASEQEEPVLAYGPHGSPRRTVRQSPEAFVEESLQAYVEDGLTPPSLASMFSSCLIPDAQESLAYVEEGLPPPSLASIFSSDLNPEAAEFTPSCLLLPAMPPAMPSALPPSLPPLAAQRPPMPPPMAPPLPGHCAAPSPWELSDEEQAKLLGAQLFVDIGGVGSPGSARTSAGTAEHETGEDETEEEDRAALGGIRGISVAIAASAL